MARIIIFGLAIIAGSFAIAETPDELIAKLRAIPLKEDVAAMHGDEFFDMHGNAIEELQGLMKQRFEATLSIRRELERPRLPKRYAEALYDVPAFVKDPAAIPWLERRRHEADGGILGQSLVGEGWRTRLYGAIHEDSKWLHEPDEWAAFFRRVIMDATEEAERIRLERVLAGWLNDGTTIDFFVRLEKTARAQSEELLCAQLFLKQHKLTYDSEKTEASITALRSSAAGRKILLEYVDELRDASFIPWLIEIVGPDTEPVEVGNAQWILEEITFQRGISGRSNWESWFERHRSEGRRQWIAASLAEVKKVAEANPQAAHVILEKAVYRWKDRDALPYMRKLTRQPELASDLVGWINLSYHAYWREDMEAFATEVVRMNRALWRLGPSICLNALISFRTSRSLGTIMLL